MKAILEFILSLFRKSEPVQEVEIVPKDIKRYFTEEEYLNGHATWSELPLEHRNNITILLDKVSMVRRRYGCPMIVTSGYRPEAYNESVGGAPNSAHISGMAIDISDPDKQLATFIYNNYDLLVELDLYVEDPAKTSNWVHIQTRPTNSGERIFLP